MAANVVVGVDGSAPSIAALAEGVRQARWRQADLVLVSAYSYPYLSLVTPVAPDPPLAVDLEGAARRTVEEAIETVRSTVGELGVHVDVDVRCGPPVSALLDASKDADLLVLGARGRGGFASLLLGSVSQQCIQHASCPVLIVRE